MRNYFVWFLEDYHQRQFHFNIKYAKQEYVNKEVDI